MLGSAVGTFVGTTGEGRQMVDSTGGTPQVLSRSVGIQAEGHFQWSQMLLRSFHCCSRRGQDCAYGVLFN